MIRVVSIPMWLFDDIVEKPDALELLHEFGAMLELRPEDDAETKVDFN